MSDMIVVAVDLLKAREAAVNKAVQAAGGEKPNNTDPVVGVMVLAVREAAGVGFDQAIEYIASKPIPKAYP